MTLLPQALRCVRSWRSDILKLAASSLLLAGLAILSASTVGADEPAAKDKEKEAVAKDAAPVKAEGSTTSSSSGGSSSGSGSSAPKPKFPPHSEVLKDFAPVDGLVKMYRKDGRLYAELTGGQMNRDFIILISIAKGIGEGPLLGGMSWGFGDDAAWQFRKVDDNIHVVLRNVRFRASPNTPEDKAVKLAYSDSILFSLPILTMGPSGGYVVDFGQIFMSDLPQISHVLPGFSFSSNKSTWAEVKGFRDNTELEVAATYASGGGSVLETVPDSRGLTLNIHYSISLLPETGYTPRQADDRVGYFLTVVKDFSKKGDQDRFIRYINRWDLQKADPSADVSPPKKPIVFWIERTVPFAYRKPIREGILEWNKAFEKAGILNAIEVRQQPDNADWDPEDINYNTFRWITAGAGFAMGPSRVNPVTGQILDADIIFDADFVQHWKQEYENFTPQSIAAMTGGPLDLETYQRELALVPPRHRHSMMCRCELHTGMSRELALGNAALVSRVTGPALLKEQEKLLMQGLKEVTMHEVGHTLGLRHNFKSSTMLTLAELNNPEKTKDVGLTGSVMDYSPSNLVPKGMKQGDYYSSTVGPYDMWAIEYGYKPLSGGTEGELADLKKIASRSAEPELAYATDEDTRGIDPDPLTNRFDLGKEPLDYSKQRIKLISELWPGIVDRVTDSGDGYQRARQAFGILLGNHGQATYLASRYVGGIYVNRDHKGDEKGRAPFVIVPVARQREALALVNEQIFSDKPFAFPPDLYNHLASTRWSHWGSNPPMRVDYAVHDVISMWQERILSQLLSSLTLDRLHDSELKLPSDQDAFTTAELLTTLTKSIFSEVDTPVTAEFNNRKPAISSLRRNLQRTYMKRLSNIAMGNGGGPEDCQTVAYAELSSLEGRIKKMLEGSPKLDTYSRAHLQETGDRIQKVREARLSLSRP
jgi:hypothetical protein